MFSVLGGDATKEEETPIKESQVPPKELVLNELGQYFGIRRFHVAVIACGMLMAVAPGSVICGSPYVLDDVAQEFGLGDSEASLVTTSIILGSIIGMLVTSRWFDMFGRRRVLMILISSLLLGCLLHLFIPHGDYGFIMLVTLRALIGFPYGGLMALSVPYVMEFCGDNFRGFASTIVNFGWALAGVWAISGVEMFGSNNWRLCMAWVPLIPCLVALAWLACLPESPRWLFVRGHDKEGQEVVDRVFESRPIVGWAYVGKAPSVIGGELEHQNTSMEAYHEMVSPKLRCTTIVCIVMYFTLCTGANCMFTWGPTILNRAAGQKVGLWVFKVEQAFKVLGNFIAMYMLDRAGRKFTLAVAYFSSFAIVIGLALASLLQSFHVPLVQALWLTMHIFSDAMWVGLGTYIAEAFPTMLRGTASGFTMFAGRIGGVAVPFAIGSLVHHQIGSALCIVGGLYLSGAVCSVKIPQEMAGKAMDDGYMHEESIETGLKTK